MTGPKSHDKSAIWQSAGDGACEAGLQDFLEALRLSFKERIDVKIGTMHLFT